MTKQELRDRWIKLLRQEASVYEYEARKRGETICASAINAICSEIEAFIAGIIND